MIEVSIITPTYNRRVFIPALIEIYKSQTFPKEKMEWIIIDDGRDKVEDLFIEAAKTIPNLRYQYVSEKLRIGAKRNQLNKEAKGEIIVAMDDDDYYPPQRVQTVVDAFRKYPKIDIAGSSEMYMYYIDTKKIYSMGPYGENHATNGTMAYRKRFANTHFYDNYITMGEEKTFLENYSHPIIQLDPASTILVMCHTDNTVDKHEIRNSLTVSGRKSYQIKELSYQLHDIVLNPYLQEFYRTLDIE